MKRIISFFILFLFIGGCSLSEVLQKDNLKEADLLLDMMEYKTAIDYYLRALKEDLSQRDIRKNIAYAHFQLEEMDDALKFLREELALFPDNKDAWDLLVYIFFKSNKLDEARDFLEKYDFPLSLTEENPHLGRLGCFILGMHLKETQEYDEAVRYFRRAMEKGYDRVQCYVQLADVGLSRGNLESTEELLSEAKRSCGERPEFFFMHGSRLFEKSKKNNDFLAMSIKCFEQALDLDPNFKDALLSLGCIRYNSRFYGEASEYFKRALELEPENKEIKFFLECSLKKLNEAVDKDSPPECPQEINLSKKFIDSPEIKWYTLKNDPNFVLENINYLSLEFIRTGKFHEATRRFRNGLIIYPESPVINFNLGMVYLWLNHLKDAEKHALLALRKKDFFGMLSAYRIEEILKRRKAVPKAAQIPLSQWTFELALKEGNYFLDAYDLLGSIYFKMEDLERSLLAYTKAVEIDEEDPMEHYNLGCVYSALKDWENAESEWKKAIKYEGGPKAREEKGEISKDQLKISLIVFKRHVSFRAHKALGELYLDKKLPDKALKEFEKAIELEPDDPEPHYGLGKIYQAKSQENEKYVGEAIFHFERYLYLGGKEEKEIKELLQSLKKK